MNKEFEKYNEISEILKVLAHPIRLCIVKGLINKGKCNVTYMKDCLDMPQSTVSQHLQKLRSAGIVVGERNGLEINYKVKDEKIIELVTFLFKD